MSQRPYFCKPVGSAMPDAKPRLVMAGTPSAARLHVTKNLYEISAATSSDVAAFLSKDGNKLEQASADGATGTLPGTPAA
jgi:hypothetical protein